MKIPDNVRINGVDYRVEWVDELNDGSRILEGQIDYLNAVIQLNRSLSMSHQHACIVLWHEICHGILDVYRVKDGYKLKLKNEETVVEMFARGIYQILQDSGREFFDIMPALESYQSKIETAKTGNEGGDVENDSE